MTDTIGIQYGCWNYNLSHLQDIIAFRVQVWMWTTAVSSQLLVRPSTSNARSNETVQLWPIWSSLPLHFISLPRKLRICSRQHYRHAAKECSILIISIACSQRMQHFDYSTNIYSYATLFKFLGARKSPHSLSPHLIVLMMIILNPYRYFTSAVGLSSRSVMTWRIVIVIKWSGLENVWESLRFEGLSRCGHDDGMLALFQTSEAAGGGATRWTKSPHFISSWYAIVRPISVAQRLLSALRLLLAKAHFKRLKYCSAT